MADTTWEADRLTGQHVVADLSGLLAYELNDGATAEAVEHLRGCPHCRTELVETVAASYPADVCLPRWFTSPPSPSAVQGRRSRSRDRRGAWLRRSKSLIAVIFAGAVLLSVLGHGSGHQPGDDLTPAQRHAALEQAEQADRTARNELLARVKAGEISLADVLARDDDVTGNTSIGAVLEALPGYDPTRADRLLHEAGIGRGRHLADLSPGRRRDLLLHAPAGH